MAAEDGPRRDLGGRPRDRRASACSPRACAIPNGMAWEPQTGALWTVVNERDELGSDLVPDYLTSVRTAASTAGPTATTASTSTSASSRRGPTWWPRRSCPTTRSAPHVAPLGLAFSDGAPLPPRYASGAFIGQHGSWNRKPRSGYKVVFVPFAGGKPGGQPIDVLTGFLSADGEALRPAGGRGDRRQRRAAGRRRRRQRGLARHRAALDACRVWRTRRRGGPASPSRCRTRDRAVDARVVATLVSQSGFGRAQAPCNVPEAAEHTSGIARHQRPNQQASSPDRPAAIRARCHHQPAALAHRVSGPYCARHDQRCAEKRLGLNVVCNAMNESGARIYRIVAAQASA